jgi:hypothetical protein
MTAPPTHRRTRSARTEHRAHLVVGRFVRAWSKSSLRKMTTGAKQRSAIYQLTIRPGVGRTVRVSADEIVTLVSAWLAELGANSPLVDDLARAVRANDWQRAHELGDYLMVEVTPAG